MDTLDLELVPQAPRIGRDELNLAEFPFALLHSRPPKNAPLVLEFKDGEKEWTVEGSPKFGLPMAPDIEVYVVLMEVTREQNFPHDVQFCRRDLIKRLGWDPNGRSYERLTLSLDRLVGVTIRTRNAFFDARQRAWSSKEAFHILERYKIMDGTLAGASQASLFPSWVRWSPELYANLQAGYIKSLDVNLFLSLRSAISQALYRYLDKKRGGDNKPMFRIALKTLVFEHLGMSRGYYPSEAKHKLKPAHEELLSIGFLSGVEYAPMKNGAEMVVYRFAPKPEKEERATRHSSPMPVLPAPLSPLAQALVDAGVSRAAAQELAASHADEAQRQLELLPYREARDPGAVLVKAIREGWAAPPESPEAKARAQVQLQAKARTVRATRRTPKPESTPPATSAFDIWFRALPAAEREPLEAQAMVQLRSENRMVGEFAAKHPESPVVQDALRPYLVKLSRWTVDVN